MVETVSLPQIAVAQLGARMHYAVPQVLHEAGMLEQLFTDSYFGNKPWFQPLFRLFARGWAPSSMTRLLGRSNQAIPPSKVTSFDLLGLRQAMARRWSRPEGWADRMFAAQGKAFNARVIGCGIDGANTVYGFNGAALELFRWAKGRGLSCILEQTIAPRRIEVELLRQEAERWPGWQPGLAVSERDHELARREEEEWKLSDLIVAGSDFVRDGLLGSGVRADICRVVPYGVAAGHSGETDYPLRAHGPLRVLFVGEVGLRKGAPYLLEALRRLNSRRIEARFAGGIALAAGMLKSYAGCASLLGAVPRAQMSELYRWADLMVLPSLCEGSAVATYEALCAGVPVVCTPNTGSVVRDGIDGHVVPIRDIDALAHWLDNYAVVPKRLGPLAKAARERAAQFTLDVYRDRLITAISEFRR